METYSFIGSDKNAGKTTAFNYVYRDYMKKGRSVLLTSIGINGENTDNYDGKRKPAVRVFKNSFFLSACNHLDSFNGKYKVIRIFPGFLYGKDYLFGEALIDIDMVIEGPNSGSDILKIKREILNTGINDIMLIDGSIDRQFLGNPEISDGFYFSLLISDRTEQLRKAKGLLKSLNIPEADENTKKLINKVKGSVTKSLLIKSDGRIVYKGESIPFMDKELKQKIKEMEVEKTTIYINGALTQSFYGFLSFFKKLTIVIDNFTQYQNISVNDKVKFNNNIHLLNKTYVKKIFLKEIRKTRFELPREVPVQNIFRQPL